MAWNNVQHSEVGRIDRVAGVFEVWAGPELPIAKFKIKVIERVDAQFLAFPNVAILNAKTNHPEWTSGMGTSIESALQDSLDYLFREIKKHAPDRPLTEDDLAWAAPEDF